jgi:hypothetical protein
LRGIRHGYDYAALERACRWSLGVYIRLDGLIWWLCHKTSRRKESRMPRRGRERKR